MANVTLSSGAETDYEEALLRYESIGRAVALRFEKRFRELADFVGRFPEASALCDDVHRWRTVRKFPYGIVYRIETGNVFVVGVPHHAELPKAWKRR